MEATRKLPLRKSLQLGRIVRRMMLLFPLGTTAGCLGSDRPTTVGACPRDADGRRPSSGSFRVLPSDVPELTLDSMRWAMRTGTPDMAFRTSLLYEGRVVASRETPLWDIGVLYESTKDSILAPAHLQRQFIFNHPEDRTDHSGELVEIHRARPARAASIWDARQIAGWRPNPAWGCPSTARLIRLMNLPTHTGLTGHVARDSARQLAALRASGRPLAPLEILLDTVIALNPDSAAAVYEEPPMLAGIAVNTTNDSLHDAAVWFAIDFTPARGGVDTVVFAIGDVAPHALVPFAGSSVRPSDARLGRGTWIGAANVAGVTEAFDHRLSRFRQRNGEPPSTVPADEIASPTPAPPRVWSPVDIDLLLVMIEPIGFARRRTSADGNTRSDLVIVDGNILRRRQTAAPAGIDTASARIDGSRVIDGTLMYELTRRADSVYEAQKRLGLDDPTRGISDADLNRPVAPGEEMLALRHFTHGTMIAIRYPIEHPPTYLTDLLRMLDRAETRYFSTRARR